MDKYIYLSIHRPFREGHHGPAHGKAGAAGEGGAGAVRRGIGGDVRPLGGVAAGFRRAESAAGSFSPSRVFWLFLAQVLSADPSCRGILRKFLGWMALRGRSASARTAGYCKGRSRLPQAPLEEAHRRLAGKIRSAHLPSASGSAGPSRSWTAPGCPCPTPLRFQRLYPQPKGANRAALFRSCASWPCSAWAPAC